MCLKDCLFIAVYCFMILILPTRRLNLLKITVRESLEVGCTIQSTDIFLKSY